MPYGIAAKRSRLGTNGQGFDANWMDNEKGAVYTNYVQDESKSIEYQQGIVDFVNVAAVTQLSYAGTASFQLAKQLDQTTKMQLVVGRSALTCGAGGVQPVFNDWEGYSSIDEVTFSSNNQIFWRIKGRTLFNDMMTGNDGHTWKNS